MALESFRVRFEPIGEELDCGADETVLDAAFRCGYNLVHGCREGRCSACKAFIVNDGWVDLKKYSSFALSESEEESGYTLLCRAVPESDLVIELLHYDPDHYRLEHPIVDGVARVAVLESLTHDIRRLVLDIDQPAGPLGFRPGQFVDLWIPGMDQRRSFSMANLPGDGRLELIIKRYPDGLFATLLDRDLRIGDTLRFTGPYGSCYLRDTGGSRAALLVAGGSGMSPVLALLRQMAADGAGRTVRFFYGARGTGDLFYLDLIAELGAQIEDFEFIPVLSHEAPDGSARFQHGFVHEALDRWLSTAAVAVSDFDVYMAGPPPMVDAATEVLSFRHGSDPNRVFVDRFTFTGPEEDLESGAVAAMAGPPQRGDSHDELNQ
jgi:2-polyprenylphenol hydroxylase and related flavodoxin oxidoreductases